MPENNIEAVPSEEEIIEFAAHLRKPQGERGIEVGEAMNAGNGPMNRFTLAALCPKESDCVLELGMGNGAFVSELLGAHPGLRYTGLDYSDVMVETARNNNQLHLSQLRAKFVHADAKSIPLESNQFDIVFTVNTVYFWDEFSTVAQELRRVLKNGGRMILSLRPDSCMNLYPVTAYNFRVWTKEELIDAMVSEGFSFVQSTHIHEPDQILRDKPLPRQTWILEFNKE